MYYRKEIRFGSYIEICKYYNGRQKQGRRARKEKPTEDPVKAYNDRQAMKKLQRLIIANFGEGDFHMTISYRMEERPADMEEAKKEVRKFNTRMKRDCRKIGREWKAIWVTERGKKGGCHHHFITENFPELMDLVRKNWKHGHADYKPMYEEGAYEQLAEYLLKKETKEEVTGCSYSHTRNLIKPVEKVEKINAARWSKEPKPMKGYEIVKNSLVNGENPFTGAPYQSYMMRREPEKKRRRT